MASRTPSNPPAVFRTRAILRHWRDDVPNDRLAHLITDTARSLRRALQIRLREHSISLGQWPILRQLWEEDGLTQRELSERVGLKEATAFAALKGLMAAGLVLRGPKEGSHRKSYIMLTEAGGALKDKLVPLAVEVNDVAFGGSSGRDHAALRRTLLKALESLARDEEELLRADRRMPSTREVSTFSNAQRVSTGSAKNAGKPPAQRKARQSASPDETAVKQVARRGPISSIRG